MKSLGTSAAFLFASLGICFALWLGGALVLRLASELGDQSAEPGIGLEAEPGPPAGYGYGWR